MRATRTSWVRLLALFAVLTLLATACGGGTTQDPSEAPPASDDASEPAESEAAESEAPAEGDGATMVFGTSADPVVLDGILVSDGESLRAIDQMFEGLVTLAPGGTEIEPNLATEWEASGDGKEWTFQLRDDVTFHDGEPFNAEAVCANFERWYNFEGTFQNPNATYYWQTVFGGFNKIDPKFKDSVPADSLYGGCSADDEHTVTLTLTKPSASFLAALALTNFTFASPKALEEYGADEGEIDKDGIFRPTGTYGTEHPTGTGPFMFDSWTRNDRLVMKRNPDYWGEVEGNIETLIFRPIEATSALQALQNGEINGYDLVAPEDFETIEGDSNLQLLSRPAFNIGYVGFAQGNEPFDQLAVRQAFAHAINRQELVDAFYVGQGQVATQFMPPELFGYADDVKEYEYDPEKAKQILEDAGIEMPVKIDFAYPTDVSRPYMPDPEANFQAMVTNLEACCFEVEEKSAVWDPNYVDNANNGRYGAYLLGWTGDFGDPDNFIGTFFQDKSPAWGFDNQEIFDLLDQAEIETDEAERTELYEEANRKIMEFLPGLPYVHTKPALAFTANVEGYQPSPVSLEPFSSVTITE